MGEGKEKIGRSYLSMLERQRRIRYEGMAAKKRSYMVSRWTSGRMLHRCPHQSSTPR